MILTGRRVPAELLDYVDSVTTITTLEKEEKIKTANTEE